MVPYQVFTSQNYPYVQKHSWVHVTEMVTLKRAFFVEPLGVDGGVNPLGSFYDIDQFSNAMVFL